MGRRVEIGDWNSARICGSIALFLVAIVFLSWASPARAAFGFKSVDSLFTAPGGEAAASLPAGSHPQSWTTTLAFNTAGAPGAEHPDGALRNLTITLPTGLVGAPALLPECSRADYLAESCPGATAVGQLSFNVGETLPPSTIYLLAPLPGSAAQLGFQVQTIQVTIDLSISPAPPHNLIARVTNASQVGELFGASLSLEGVPNGNPFLTMPRSCGDPLTTTFLAAPWQPPAVPVSATAPDPQATVACAALSYNPDITATPTTSAASAPTGLVLDLDAPDPGIASAGGRAAADTRSATLELPPGMTVNPPLAAGLVGCTPAEVAGERPDADPATGCPEAAKIGTASVETPLFDRPIAGDVYVAAPDENPVGSMLALYLVLRDPDRGVLLSLPIGVDADAATGRLTARFEQIPELPIAHLSLRLNSGPHAPLATPSGCGTHTIGYSLEPSSGNPPSVGEESFETTSGCGAAFAPELTAGTKSNAAGSAAPFVLDLRNAATAPNLEGLRATLPPGVAADLSAAAVCPEAGAATGACPGGSRLGYARIALGAGPEPLWVPGGDAPDSDVFLAGPYRGAPFSLLVSVPAAAGPFDLGRVVLRAPIAVDPQTAGLSVSFDGLPQIREGIPLHYRAIRLVLDRPGFIRNPTSCEPMRIELTASAAGGATASAGDRFQAADCGALGFRPRLRVWLAGNLGRNGHPRVRVRFAPRPGEANLAGATVDLPRGELLDTRRIRALCDRSLPARQCPAAARLGRVTLRTPLLQDPLRSPIYLRTPSRRYPDLVAEVEGGGVRFVVHGRTGSARGRIRVRLHGLPDIPLSESSIVLAGGRRGIVVNSVSLCNRKRRARATLVAHSGRRATLRPALTLSHVCYAGWRDS